MPPREEYQEYIQAIWERNWLTNNGPLVNELELQLKNYLGLPHVLFINNGTIALQIAIKALELKGEIITTPFSYVATTSSIVWENCKPVFSDIDPGSLNIDPSKIETAITPNTVAIMATHVYGNPCDIERLKDIADKHKLRIIYDAAHCFGTTYKGKSVFSYGDIVATSFHATKLFHSIEGGALFSNDPLLVKKMSYLRNFGHNGPEDFVEVGINGKNSEFHAAMGLVNLRHIASILASRKWQSEQYDQWLRGQEGITHPVINPLAGYNYSYYPIILNSEATTQKLIKEMEANKIFPRRYFYPSLNTLPIYKDGSMPVSESISPRILCLPLYHTLTSEEIDFVCRIILRSIRYSA